MTTNRRNRTSGRTCAFLECSSLQTSDPDHPLCRQHYYQAQKGSITKCSRCASFKPARLPLCNSCFVGGSPVAATRQQPGGSKSDPGTYQVENSPAWHRADASASYFYTYILRLSDGEFYIGQTRELPERLSEHRDGKVGTTKGKTPELVWFTELASRDEATKLEAALKQTRDRDERSIRRMIVRFQNV